MSDPAEMPPVTPPAEDPNAAPETAAQTPEERIAALEADVAQLRERWLRAEAPPRPWCKVVAALQGIVLTVAASGLLPEKAAAAAVLVALVLLVESFAHETW